jgi:hypothetical protein
MSKFAPHRRAANSPRATSSTICQKCLRTGSSSVPTPCVAPRGCSITKFFFFFVGKTHTGHFTYECKSARPYVTRPSRTAQLENPRLLAKTKAEGKPPSVEVPEEFKNKFRHVFFSLLMSNPSNPLGLTFRVCVCVHVCLSCGVQERNRGSDLDGKGEATRERAQQGTSQETDEKVCPTHVLRNPPFPCVAFPLQSLLGLTKTMCVGTTRSSSNASASSVSDSGSSSGSELSSDAGSDAESESSSSSSNSNNSRIRSRERDQKRRRPRGRSVSSASSRGRWDRERSASPIR